MSQVVREEASPGDRLASVAVTIVTYNSAKYIRRCLEFVLQQDYPNLQIVVVDNASSDGSVSEIDCFRTRVLFIQNATNTGFAAGQNLAIAQTNSDWVLTLNPDVRLTPGFVRLLVHAAETDPSIGTACGKLLAMRDDFAIPDRAVFDSTGIFMTPNLRHLDRGSRTPDDGSFDTAQYVFGATGAAALYRRSMIGDVAINNEFFDEDFFAYREDADIAWRAQLLGWKCLYTPAAVAYHVRSVLPENRRAISPIINMHSVKNRFLMRIKNATVGLYRRFWLSMTVRDAAVIAGCFFREWTSLPGLWLVLRTFSKTWRKRKQIMARKRVSDEYIAQWFSFHPFSLPAGTERHEKTVVR